MEKTQEENKKVEESYLTSLTADLGNMLKRTTSSISAGSGQNSVSHPTTTETTPTTSNASNVASRGLSMFSSYLDKAASTVLASGNEAPNESDLMRERNALYSAFKASLTALVDAHAGSVVPLEDGDEMLERFCTVIEHVLSHGLKSRRGWKKISVFDYLVAVLDQTSATTLERRHQFDTLRSMEGLRTPKGRLRAWIRMSLMDQSLPDSLLILFNPNPDVASVAFLDEFYEQWALMRSEKFTEMSGMLLALQSIEFNLCLKGDDLESRASTIDWGFFFVSSAQSASSSLTSPRDASFTSATPLVSTLDNQQEGSNMQISSLLSSAQQQKLYLEDLNRQLKQQMCQMQSDLEKSRVESANNQEVIQQLRSLIERKDLERQQSDSRFQQLQLSSDRDRSEFELKLSRQGELMNDLRREVEEMRSIKVKLQEKLAQTLKERQEAVDEKSKIMEMLKATQSHLVTSIKAKEELKQELRLLRGLSSNSEPPSPVVPDFPLSPPP